MEASVEELSEENKALIQYAESDWQSIKARNYKRFIKKDPEIASNKELLAKSRKDVRSQTPLARYFILSHSVQLRLRSQTAYEKIRYAIEHVSYEECLIIAAQFGTDIFHR